MTKTPRKRLTPPQQLSRYALRYVKTRQQGKAKFATSGVLIQKMIALGFKPGESIEVPGEGKFVLVDNFNGERTGGWATVVRFELKKLAKNPRQPKPEVEAVVPTALEEAA